MHADFEEVSTDALAALRLVEAGEEHGRLPGKPPGDGRHLLICQLGGSRLHALPAQAGTADSAAARFTTTQSNSISRKG